MKKLILSIALLSTPLIASANQYYPNNSNGFNTPNFNWGNGNNNSSWNMPNMNWGNGNNGYGNNWNMPNMNWGNNNGGSNWNMPNMNWGNNNNRNGSSWNMPNMNWGNGNNNGSSWNMPNMNWGNNNNGYTYVNPRNYGNTGYYKFVPQAIYRAPAPRPQLKAQAAPPKAATPPITTPQATKPVTQAVKKAETIVNKIPTPSEVKGVIIAPENKPEATPEKASIK